MVHTASNQHNTVVVWLVLTISPPTFIVGVELRIQILHCLFDVAALHIPTRSVTPIHSLDFCGCFVGLWVVYFYVCNKGHLKFISVNVI